MKVWKVAEVSETYLSTRLEEKLNELQGAGCEIKTVYPSAVHNGHTIWVKIVYTEENIEEE